MRSLRILILDNNEDMLAAMTQTLKDMGHQVDAFSDLTAAIHGVQLQHDLLITDGHLGDGTTGLDFLRTIRARMMIPIFMHSGDDRLGAAFLNGGGQMFIHKLQQGGLKAAISEWFDDEEEQHDDCDPRGCEECMDRAIGKADDLMDAMKERANE